MVYPETSIRSWPNTSSASPSSQVNASSPPSATRTSLQTDTSTLPDTVIVRILNMLSARDQVSAVHAFPSWNAVYLRWAGGLSHLLCWASNADRCTCVERMCSGTPEQLQSASKRLPSLFRTPFDMVDWLLETSASASQLTCVGRALFRTTKDDERAQVTDHIVQRRTRRQNNEKVLAFLIGYLPAYECGGVVASLLLATPATRLETLCFVQGFTKDLDLGYQLQVWQDLSPHLSDRELCFLLRRDISVLPFAVTDDQWRIIEPTLLSTNRLWSDPALCHTHVFPARMQQIIEREAGRCASLPLGLKTRRTMTETSVLLEELHPENSHLAHKLWRTFCGLVSPGHLTNFLQYPGRTDLRPIPNMPFWQLYRVVRHLSEDDLIRCLNQDISCESQLVACIAMQKSKNPSAFLRQIYGRELTQSTYISAVHFCAIHSKLDRALGVLTGLFLESTIPHLLKAIKLLDFSAAMRLAIKLCEKASDSEWQQVMVMSNRDLHHRKNLIAFLCTAMQFTNRRNQAMADFVLSMQKGDNSYYLIQRLLWIARINQQEAERVLTETISCGEPCQHFLIACFARMETWISLSILQNCPDNRFLMVARCFSYAYGHPNITSQNHSFIMYQNDTKLLHVVTEVAVKRFHTLLNVLKLPKTDGRRLANHLKLQGAINCRYPSVETVMKLTALFFSDSRWSRQSDADIRDLVRWHAIYDLSVARSIAKTYLTSRSRHEVVLPYDLIIAADETLVDGVLERIDLLPVEALQQLLPFVVQKMSAEGVRRLTAQHTLGLWRDGLLGYLNDTQLNALDTMALEQFNGSPSSHLRSYLIARKQCQRDLNRPTNEAFEEAWRRLQNPARSSTLSEETKQAVCYQDELPTSLQGYDVTDLAYLRGSQGRARQKVLNDVLKNLGLDNDELEAHDCTPMTAYYVLFHEINKTEDPVRIIDLRDEETYCSTLKQRLIDLLARKSIVTKEQFLDYVKGLF